MVVRLVTTISTPHISETVPRTLIMEPVGVMLRLLSRSFLSFAICPRLSQVIDQRRKRIAQQDGVHDAFREAAFKRISTVSTPIRIP